MQVKQIYELMNTVTGEALGESAVLAEDLSNTVEIGAAIEDVMGLDNFVRTLTDHVGRMVFVNRKYAGRVPSMLMDGWEFGAILEKVSAKLPEATENESWQLEDGASYDPNIFYKPEVTAKFWNKRVTFEVPMSITEMQVKSAFTSGTQLNAFISMLYMAIENSMTITLDALIMRVVNNLAAETVNADYGSAAISSKSGTRAVNLLYLFNNLPGKTSADAITAAAAITDPDFIRFASAEIGKYTDRLSTMSTLFNIEGAERFTPADALHIVMLSEFRRNADAYLQSDTFHKELTQLPEAETVPFWQGSGDDFAFTSTGTINVKTATGADVEVTGVLCVMFDRNAAGVTNMNRRVTSNYNPKGEFWNQWHKMDAGYFNALDENAVLFFVA